MLIVLYCFTNNFVHSNSNGNTKRVISTIKKIPKAYWIFLIPISLLSLYSLFLGKYNSITISTQIPLREMYLKLPEGIYYQFTQKLGFPLLFSILTINSVVINKKFKTVEGEKIMLIFKWIGIFSLCYILLLPLGGYRIYRPNILRYDTIMPITLSLFFIFGITTLFILKSISNRQKIVYLPLIIGVLFIYTNADEAKFNNNKCERNALKIIADSKDKVVQLSTNCTVIAWEMITKPEGSELDAELLNIWNITKEKKLYFNQ